MKHQAVTVVRDGEPVVTIETNCLSGRDLSPEDEDAIRSCAQQLLSFVGPEKAPMICADGFHVAESMSMQTNRRRCVKCGHEWLFPSERQKATGVPV